MNFNKFIILTSGRSGSTYLQQLLNSHPTLKSHDEIFNVTNKNSISFYSFCRNRYPKISWFFLRSKISKYSWNSPLAYLFKQYLKLIYEESYPGKIGFKLIYNQLLHYHPLTSWITKNSIPIIHLQRINFLKAAISLLKARETGVYTLTSTKSTNYQKINISPISILKELDCLSKEQSYCEDLIRNNPTLTIYYEDLFKNQSACLQQILVFLQIEELQFQKPDIVKTNPEKISDLLENFEEVKLALTGTRWEKYLD